MFRQNIKAGRIDLDVFGYNEADNFAEPLVVIGTSTGGLYGTLHLTPSEAKALASALVSAADATAVQVAA